MGSTWAAFIAPAGVPKAIVDHLNREIQEVQKSPKMMEMAENLGASIMPGTPDELRSRIRRELVDYGKLMKEAGIQPQ